MSTLPVCVVRGRREEGGGRREEGEGKEGEGGRRGLDGKEEKEKKYQGSNLEGSVAVDVPTVHFYTISLNKELEKI
jgi:hypothetical protein